MSEQQQAGAPWQNRITGYGEADPRELIANPKNWRLHPEEQRAALLTIFRTVGIVQNVIVNRATGFIVDGHARVALAAEEPGQRLPVTYVDLSPEEEELILATYDPLAALAQVDIEQLEALVVRVDLNDPELAPLGVLWAEDGNGPEEYADTFGSGRQGTSEGAYQPKYDRGAYGEASPAELPPSPNPIPSGNRYKEQYGVIVLCQDEAHQEQIYTRLRAEGLNCRVVVT